MTPSFPRDAACAALALIAASAATARAGGVNIPGYGSQAQPRAGAFVAKADDPTAIFHNPAGLARIAATAITLSIDMIDFRQSYQRAGTYDEIDEADLPYEGSEYARVEDGSSPELGIGGVQAVPLFAATSRLGLDLPIAFAFGVFVPGKGYPERSYTPDYQLEGNPNEPPPPQRYDLITQKIVMVMPSLAVAYQVHDRVSVGVRGSWGITQLKGRSSLWGVRNYHEWEGDDGTFAIDVEDRFVPSYGAGVLVEATDNLELGLSYRSASNIAAEGVGQAVLGSHTAEFGIESLDPITMNPRCSAGGTAVNLRTCVDLSLPQTAIAGARWVFRDDGGQERADVEFDVAWEDWSASSDITIVVDARTPIAPLFTTTVKHGFQDVYSFRLGGHYALPVSAHMLELRAGVAHDTATAPVSWTRLDIDGFARTTVGAGVGYDIGSYRFDLGLGAVFEGKRVVGDDCNPDNDNPGCAPGGGETPIAERDRPDPAQPTFSPSLQNESPFNAGTYEQGYLLLSAGLTTEF